MPALAVSPVSVQLAFMLSPRDHEDLRWYLEDYLESPHDPMPRIAARVEARMRELGEQLFCGIFQASREPSDIWSVVGPHLRDTRIEIATGVVEAAAIPWELIADPRDGWPLALTTRSFVRVAYGAQVALPPAQADVGKVRILLVICRPGGGGDILFRSVAIWLVKSLNDAARDTFDLDVLRPPTFERLCQVLRDAKERGTPYHVVHFDGHGIYADPADLQRRGAVEGRLKDLLSSLKYGTGRTGRQGYLIFENPAHKHNSGFVAGGTLGRLLQEAQVPLLVINACQSAMAAAVARPAEQPQTELRQELAAYGSLAQEVVNAGTAGVVAMRYSVYVVTAAQFVAGLYATLAVGRTLGEAVARARKNLADDPLRQLGQERRSLQDWVVPVVWERAEVHLWPQQVDAPIRISLSADGEATGVDARLPKPPDLGFFGRDETLLALDRAFDQHKIVLLHAYAGAGRRRPRRSSPAGTS